MKIDHSFITLLTSTHPTGLSWICHIYTLADRGEAQSRKNFLLEKVFPGMLS
jgi:hypothetical protein